MEKRFQRVTTIKYLAALFVIALLSFVAYYMLNKAIQTQKSSAAIINAGGRRRMLSQQTVFFSHLVVNANSTAERKEAKTRLRETVLDLERTHKGLIYGDANLNLPGNPAPKLAQLYFSPESNLDQLVTEFIENANLVLHTSEDGPTEVERNALEIMFADAIGPFFHKLDTAVALYQSESEEKYHFINQIEAFVFGATLLLLIAEAIFIFRPLTAQFTQLLLQVEEKSGEVQRLLDHVGQGFFALDAKGMVGPSYSKTVEALFGMKPAGLHVSKVMGQSEDAWNGHVSLLFNERVPFDSLVAVCPQTITINDCVIELVYRQLRDSHGVLNRIMVVATDVTKLRAAERRADVEKATNKALLAILGAKVQFAELLELLTTLPMSADSETEVKRAIHTLKGGFAFFELRETAEKFHTLETGMKNGYDKALFLKAHFEIADHLGKFLARYERVLNLRGGEKNLVSVSAERIDQLIQTALSERVSAKVLNSIESLKQVSLEESLGWLNGVFKSTARELGKSVLPIVWEPSSMVAAEDYQKLFMSLVHIARNSADHGIERAAIREAIGKPRAGQLRVRLTEENGVYRLTFRDDGAGVDLSRVRAKADALGMNVDGMTDEAILDLLFDAGFSTNEKVSEHSGRGVGLDAVRSEARRLGGDVKATNFPGKGLQIEVWFRKQNGMICEIAA